MIPAGSGWVLIEARGINAAGQITGMGMHNGQEHAFLLTPQ
jgi:probable HAF family extracellular repeat protein